MLELLLSVLFSLTPSVFFPLFAVCFFVLFLLWFNRVFFLALSFILRHLFVLFASLTIFGFASLLLRCKMYIRKCGKVNVIEETAMKCVLTAEYFMCRHIYTHIHSSLSSRIPIVSVIRLSFACSVSLCLKTKANNNWQYAKRGQNV